MSQEIKTGNLKEPKQIRLIPFVCGAGAKILGTELGPVEIKKHGLQSQLSNTWRQVAWFEDPEVLYQRERELYKDLPPLGSAARREFVLRHCRDIADRVETVVKSGAMPVTIGGDHSMAAGTIAGFARAKNAQGRVGVIWIDAHADIHTMETTPSKTYHGMPLAFLLGLGDKDFAKIGGARATLRPENIVYFGLRSTEAAENRRISDLGIHAFSMKDIKGNDVNKIFQRAWKTISKNVDYLVVSIDLDAFDPGDAPAVGSPEGGGLRRDDVLRALENLRKTRAPDMVEIVEFNPALEGAEKTYGLVKDILGALLGNDPFITSSGA